MGRKKTKYTFSQSSVYILNELHTTKYNPVSKFKDKLEVSENQIYKYISAINVHLYDLYFEDKKIKYDRKLKSYFIE